jgi:hypothetical protein
MAVARMPPVLLVQSTNPISAGLDPPQGGAKSPISTSKVAAWVNATPINVIRLNIKSPMKTDFLFMSNHLLFIMNRRFSIYRLKSRMIRGNLLS